MSIRFPARVGTGPPIVMGVAHNLISLIQGGHPPHNPNLNNKQGLGPAIAPPLPNRSQRNRVCLLFVLIDTGKGGHESPRWMRALGKGGGRTNSPRPKNTVFTWRDL
jgi:hypothetical protein